MSIAIEKQSGVRHKLDWRGLNLSKTAINGLIGFGNVETRKLNDLDGRSAGIFVMLFKNRIISVYYNISSKKVGVWIVKEDKS